VIWIGIVLGVVLTVGVVVWYWGKDLGKW